MNAIIRHIHTSQSRQHISPYCTEFLDLVRTQVDVVQLGQITETLDRSDLVEAQINAL